MGQCQFPRVQALTVDVRAVCRAERTAVSAVQRISQNRVPQSSHMHADLVRPSGFQVAFRQRKGIAADPTDRVTLQNAVMRNRLSRRRRGLWR